MKNKNDIRFAEVRFNDGGVNETFYYPRDAYFQKDANAFIVEEHTADGPVTHIYPREIVKSFVVKNIESA